MILYRLGYQSKGFISLRAVMGHGLGYDHQMLTETTTLFPVWTRPSVEFNKYDWNGKIANRKKHPEWYESDAPGGGFLSGRAAMALRDLWERYGELLPLESKDGEFYVYHCMNQLDAVDPPRCEFNGQNIAKYVFKPDVVRDQHIFRPSFPWKGPVFVSKVVVDRANSAGLKGFEFKPVWSEETGPIVEESTLPAIEQPQRAKGCRPMSLSTRKDVVDKLVAMAKKDLNIDVSSDAPEKVLERISQEIKSAQGWAHRVDEVVGVGMVVGSLWGELVCREFGWSWAIVDAVAAVVSPTQSHVVFPHIGFHQVIRVCGEPKHIQLYELIKSGLLPSSEPAGYLVLAL